MIIVTSRDEGERPTWSVMQKGSVISGPHHSKEAASAEFQRIVSEQRKKTIDLHENMTGIYRIIGDNAPLTVAEYFKLSIGDQYNAPEFRVLVPYLLQMMNTLVLAGVASIDQPVTEHSMIHGITDQGWQSFELYMRDYAPTR